MECSKCSVVSVVSRVEVDSVECIKWCDSSTERPVGYTHTTYGVVLEAKSLHSTYYTLLTLLGGCPIPHFCE